MTLKELREMVRATMPAEVTDVTDTYLTTLVNQCVQEVARADEWPWLQATGTITTIVDTASYALPANFSFGLAIVNTTNNSTIPPISPQTYFHMFGDDDDAKTNATHFTVFNGSIYLAPVPSEATANKYNLYYYKNPTLLTSLSNEPEWNKAFHWLVVDWVASKLYRRESLMEQSMFHGAEYNATLQEMRRWYRRSFESTRPLRGDGLYGRADANNLPGFTFG